MQISETQFRRCVIKFEFLAKINECGNLLAENLNGQLYKFDIMVPKPSLLKVEFTGSGHMIASVMYLHTAECKSGAKNH